MDRARFTVARACWMVCTCLLLLPRFAAAAEPLLSTDLDGDGQRDVVMQSHREPSTVGVWLSASQTRHVIHTSAPLLRVVAADLDGDHRPELIARDNESRVHVWTQHRKQFHSYRPHPPVHVTLTQANHHCVDDGDSEPSDTIATTFTPLAPLLCPLPRAPDTVAANARALHTAPARSSFTPADPFLPRPPPTRTAL